MDEDKIEARILGEWIGFIKFWAGRIEQRGVSVSVRVSYKQVRSELEKIRERGPS